MKSIFANWKNQLTHQEACALAEAMVTAPKKLVERLILFPSDISLVAVQTITKGSAIQVGAQNLFWSDEVVCTGEITAYTLAKQGVRYVLVGHAERRRLQAEDPLMISHKLATALSNGLTPIWCVGDQTDPVYISETLTSFAASHANRSIILAYEPEGAIGGSARPLREVKTSLRHLREACLHTPFALQYLYGGGVTAHEAREFLQSEEIDGLLVGRHGQSVATLMPLLEALDV